MSDSQKRLAPGFPSDTDPDSWKIVQMTRGESNDSGDAKEGTE